MAFSASSADFPVFPSRSGALRWIASGLCAPAITIVLCALIPALLHQASPPWVLQSAPMPINVIRIKRPDTPPNRKKPRPQVAAPKKKQPLPEAPRHQVLSAKLTLPFEINPKLPSGLQNTAIPPMAQTGLDDFGLPKVFAAGDLDQPLITLTRMPPLYPLRAKQSHIQGWVKVRFMVTAQGTVEQVAIIEAQPPGVFEQSVTRCVSGWRFKPGTVAGVPVNTWAETTITFELKG
jgi:protein TonB